MKNDEFPTTATLYPFKSIVFLWHFIFLCLWRSGDLKTPEMLALNPRGMVPIFVDGEIVMYESLAIITYLETFYVNNGNNQNQVNGHSENHDQTNTNTATTGMSGIGRKLTPDKSKRRLVAKAFVRMHEVNNASAHVGEVVYYLRRTKPEDVNLVYLNSKRDNMYSEVSLWERYLDTGDDFLAGSTISLADICFFPTLAYMVRLGFNLSRFPRLKGYYGRMLKRNSVQASWPPHWKQNEATSTPLKDL